MKMNIIQSLFASALASVLLISCQPNGKKVTENDVRFDSIAVDKTYYMLDQPDNPNCNLQIKFVYPAHFETSEALNRIKQHFIVSCFGEAYEELTPQQAVDGYVNLYLENYKSLEEDFVQEKENSKDAPVASWFFYYEMLSNEITFNKAGLLCYSVNLEHYTGGAHGASVYMNYVLNLQTGEVITEEDIFTEGSQDVLALILVDKIARQNNVTDAKELEELGFFSIDEIFPNGNFLVDEEGITFYFNEYEIAAYVVGVSRVKLRYADIKPLLKKDSPVSAFIPD